MKTANVLRLRKKLWELMYGPSCHPFRRKSGGDLLEISKTLLLPTKPPSLEEALVKGSKEVAREFLKLQKAPRIPESRKRAQRGRKFVDAWHDSQAILDSSKPPTGDAEAACVYWWRMAETHQIRLRMACMQLNEGISECQAEYHLGESAATECLKCLTKIAKLRNGHFGDDECGRILRFAVGVEVDSGIIRFNRARFRECIEICYRIIVCILECPDEITYRRCRWGVLRNVPFTIVQRAMQTSWKAIVQETMSWMRFADELLHASRRFHYFVGDLHLRLNMHASDKKAMQHFAWEMWWWCCFCPGTLSISLGGDFLDITGSLGSDEIDLKEFIGRIGQNKALVALANIVRRFAGGDVDVFVIRGNHESKKFDETHAKEVYGNDIKYVHDVRKIGPDCEACHGMNHGWDYGNSDKFARLGAALTRIHHGVSKDRSKDLETIKTMVPRWYKLNMTAAGLVKRSPVVILGKWIDDGFGDNEVLRMQFNNCMPDVPANRIQHWSSPVADDVVVQVLCHTHAMRCYKLWNGKKNHGRWIYYINGGDARCGEYGWLEEADGRIVRVGCGQFKFGRGGVDAWLETPPLDVVRGGF